MEQQYLSHSAGETEQIAADFAAGLKSGDVIAYKGPMGAGKTAFTRGLCRGLGLDESQVSSPTFALVHQYGNGEHALYHFDMYRVESYEDLYSTGFFDYLGLWRHPRHRVERKHRVGPAPQHHHGGNQPPAGGRRPRPAPGLSSGGPDFLSHLF